VGRPAVLTIGYEGRTVPELIDVLRSAGATRLVDVRALPLSRVRGFSMMPLREELIKAGLTYAHVRAAGNPFRKDAGDVLGRYAQYVTERPEIVELVEDALTGHVGALLCVEADVAVCHRGILGAALAARGYRVRDL